MAFTTDDIILRFKNASNRAANRIGLQDGTLIGIDPYDAAAYGGPGKAAAAGYSARIAAVIYTGARITHIYNQGQGVDSNSLFDARPWLDGIDTYWVHCMTNNMPDPTPYRVYVCTNLAQTHNVLRQLLQNYNRPLYFKVAAHNEAQIRNDTIVSWHQSLADAKDWATIARANAGHLEGDAPAGTFGGITTHSIGIDTEVQGDTSTSKIAREGKALAIKKSPYI